MKFWAPESQRDDVRCAATISCCPPAERLEKEWRDLEARSSGSVFLSWPWIGSMLANMSTPPLLIRVTHGEQTVALGLLGTRSGRLCSLRPASLYLNETGDQEFDRITIEYNGLLTQEGWDDVAAEIFLATIFGSKDFRRRDLYLSGMDGKWGELCRRQGLTTRLLRKPQVSPYTILQSLPANDLLATMSRNSRHQIRRSMRYYEQRGPLTLTRAEDAAQALKWLDALELLHTQSWQERKKSGAFSHPSFKAFHEYMISTSFGEGVPDLLRLQAGETIIGYLYNFRWRGIAYSYQSGFLYEKDNHARPGLVAHALAIRQYRAEGMSTYNFLAGGSRYKDSLTTDKGELFWIVAHRPNLSRWLIRMARRAANRILGRNKP